MLIELSRCSGMSDEAPDPIAREEKVWRYSRCTCKTLDEVKSKPHVAQWFYREGTRNHREENGGTVMESEYESWLADVPSLEWCFDKWGDIIVQSCDVVGVKYHVRIYDGYNE